MTAFGNTTQHREIPAGTHDLRADDAHGDEIVGTIQVYEDDDEGWLDVWSWTKDGAAIEDFRWPDRFQLTFGTSDEVDPADVVAAGESAFVFQDKGSWSSKTGTYPSVDPSNRNGVVVYKITDSAGGTIGYMRVPGMQHRMTWWLDDDGTTAVQELDLESLGTVHFDTITETDPATGDVRLTETTSGSHSYLRQNDVDNT